MGEERGSQHRPRAAPTGRDRNDETSRTGALLRLLGRNPKQQAAMLDRILSACPEHFYVLDHRGRYIYVSQTCADALGLGREQIVGKTWQDLGFPKETAETLQSQLQQLFATGQTASGEVSLPTKAGPKRYEYTLAPLLGIDHDVQAAVASLRDITERKRAEEERERLLVQLREANQQLVEAGLREKRFSEQAGLRAAELDATITSIADGVVIFDANGEIVRMNPAAQEMLGYSSEERELPLAERLELLGVQNVEGKPVSPQDTPVSRALDGQKVKGVIVLIRSRDGRTLWVSNSAAPILTDGKLIGAVAIFTDVTRLRELQEQREDLLRAVSHDLRSPLTAIQAQAQLLQRMVQQTRIDGRMRRSTEAVVLNAKRMNSMIQDLVDSARLESGQLRLELAPLELRTFVLNVKEMMAAVANVGRVRVEISDGLPTVMADANRLERILTNLLSNALKYSPPDTEVLVHAEQKGGEVVLSVRDHGPGIPPEDLPHLFHRFYRARGARKTEGVGLGLCITRRLVEAHRGRIWVESRVGKGSTFYVALPKGR